MYEVLTKILYYSEMNFTVFLCSNKLYEDSGWFNAAISGNNFSVWRSHLISRAAENQRFVISSNNANENQQCPTMLISPKGQVIAEVISSELDVIKRTIDTDDISDWYLDQCRSDVVKIISK